MAMASLVLGAIPIAVVAAVVLYLSISVPGAAAPTTIDSSTAATTNGGRTTGDFVAFCVLCLALIINGAVGLVLGREGKARLEITGEPTWPAVVGVVFNWINVAMAFWTVVLAAFIF